MTLVFRARDESVEAKAVLAGNRHGGAVWTARDGAGHFARTRDARRFRELIRAEVAATVHDPSEVGNELRHLIAITSGG